MIRHFLVLISILFLTLVTASLGSAQAAMYDQLMSSGMSSLDKKDYSTAEQAFRAALKESPDDFKASLYLGVVLNKRGEKEAQSYLKKALMQNPQDPMANLQLGVYYYDRDVYTEARDYFETVGELAPGTQYSAEARAYLNKMEEKPKTAAQKPWRVDAALGMQYDSNVIAGPDNQAPPEGISGRSDWRGVLYLKGQYDFVASERFVATASYSIYQSLHTRLSDFNITQQVAGIEGIYKLSDVAALKGSYAFEYVLVGGDEYDYMHTLSPSLVFAYGKGFSTTFSYGYSNVHFSNSTLFSTNSDRSGFNQSGSITQFAPLADFLDFKLGVAVDKDKTNAEFWTYWGNKVFADLTYRPLRDLSLNLYGEYCHRGYSGSNPYSPTGVSRIDDIQTYSATMTKQLSKIFSAMVGEIYVRNKSNVEVFDYRRWITSAFITARF